MDEMILEPEDAAKTIKEFVERRELDGRSKVDYNQADHTL